MRGWEPYLPDVPALRLERHRDGPIRSAKLRLYQRDASVDGGRVSGGSSTHWTEAITCTTQPAFEDRRSGASGRLRQAGGRRSTSRTSFKATMQCQWASTRRTATERCGRAVNRARRRRSSSSRSALRQSGTEGSRSPATVGSRSRLLANESAASSDVRRSAALGPRQTCVRRPACVARPPSGTWQTSATGATASGAMLSGTGTGDWAASIAVARDAAGAEHAWRGRACVGRVGRSMGGEVRSGPDSAAQQPRRPRRPHRRSHDHDRWAGFKPDIAFERMPPGESLGAVVWSRQTATYTSPST